MSPTNFRTYESGFSFVSISNGIDPFVLIMGGTANLPNNIIQIQFDSELKELMEFETAELTDVEDFPVSVGDKSSGMSGYFDEEDDSLLYLNVTLFRRDKLAAYIYVFSTDKDSSISLIRDLAEKLDLRIIEILGLE